MATPAPSVTPSSIKPVHLILGLALTAATVFVITWSAAKGWNKGK